MEKRSFHKTRTKMLAHAMADTARSSAFNLIVNLAMKATSAEQIAS